MKECSSSTPAGMLATVRWLLDAVTGGREGYVPLTDEIAKRAGAMLHQVRQSNTPIAGTDAPIDAMVARTWLLTYLADDPVVTLHLLRPAAG
jgi:hypothetical protein